MYEQAVELPFTFAEKRVTKVTSSFANRLRIFGIISIFLYLIWLVYIIHSSFWFPSIPACNTGIRNEFWNVHSSNALR